MKNNIFKGLFVCGVAIAMAGCSENTWNEDNLDGFEVPSLNTPKRSYIDYTFTANDYSKLSKMKACREKAQAAGVLSQLEAVGSNGYFSDVITAREYLPIWLDSAATAPGSVFKSALVNTTARISYETAADMPVPVTGINSAKAYTVTTEDYMKVYAPEDANPGDINEENVNYAEAFSPGHPASKYVPALLKTQFPDAVAGAYAYVSYNESQTNPVFGGSSDTPDKFELSSTIGSAVLNENLTCSAVVTGLSSNGIVISDKSGSIFIYLGKTAEDAYTVGQQVKITDAKVSQNYKAMQLSKPAIEVVDGTWAYTFPTAPVYDATKWDALFNSYSTTTSAVPTTYMQIEGTPYMSGTYLNVKIGESEIAMSPYGAFDVVKNALTIDVKHTIKGYVVTCNTKNKYLGMIVTEVDGKLIYALPKAAPAAFNSRAVADLASEKVNAVYEYDGSSWSVPADVYVLTATDYKQMGTSAADDVKKMLPTLFAKEYPYAVSGDVKYAVFGNNHRCEQLVYNGTEWNINTMTVKSQFVRTKDKTWIYDPTIYVTFETGKSGNFTDELSGKFWKGCIEWVWKEKCVGELNLDASLWDNWGPSDSFTTHGYVWGRGAATQEGYSGASAWYGNLDTKLSTVKKNISADDLNVYFGDVATDANKDQFAELLQKHFAEEVAAGALGMVFPDAKPGADGIDQEYEISVTQYNPTSHLVAIRYRVVAPGKFVFVECESWGLKGE